MEQIAHESRIQMRIAPAMKRLVIVMKNTGEPLETPIFFVTMKRMLNCESPNPIKWRTLASVNQICKEWRKGYGDFISELGMSFRIPEFTTKLVVFKNRSGNFVFLRDETGKLIQID